MRLGNLLMWNMDYEILQLLVPEDVDQGLELRRLTHVAAEEGNNPLKQGLGNQGQGRGKPGPDRLKVHHIVFWGNELAQLGFSQLIDLAVLSGEQADCFVRRLGLLQGGKIGRAHV